MSTYPLHKTQSIYRALTLTQLLTVAPLLALVVGAPAPAPQETEFPPPTFPENNNFTKTTEGAKPNQGAHVLLSNSFARISGLSGPGSVVTGKGLAWYTSSLTTGNGGYQDPNYYWCFRGIKENFPPFGNWMNFHDMFERNQFTTMVKYDSGPEQGAIYNAILQAAQESKVDARLILAVIMQEVPFPSPSSHSIHCTNSPSPPAMSASDAQTTESKTAV